MLCFQERLGNNLATPPPRFCEQLRKPEQCPVRKMHRKSC